MKRLLTAGFLVIVSPSIAFAQTWQEWVKENPANLSNPSARPSSGVIAPAEEPSSSHSDPAQDPSASEAAVKWELEINREIKTAFLDSCLREKPAALCECLWGGVKDKLTLRELILNHSNSPEEKAREEALEQEIMASCLRQTET